MTKRTVAAPTDSSKKEIPRVLAYEHTNHEAVVNKGAEPKRKPIYTTVSRKRWARVEAAYDARDQIADLVSDFDGVHVGVTTITSGGRKKAVVVKYLVSQVPSGGFFSPDVPVKTVRATVPAAVDGVAGRETEHKTRISNIPVVVKEERAELDAHYDGNYADLPGNC